MGAVALHLIGWGGLTGEANGHHWEEFSMTGEAFASPVNILKYALPGWAKNRLICCEAAQLVSAARLCNGSSVADKLLPHRANKENE